MKILSPPGTPFPSNRRSDINTATTNAQSVPIVSLPPAGPPSIAGAELRAQESTQTSQNGNLAPLASCDAASKRIRAAMQGEWTRKQISVKTVSPGIVNVKIKGDAAMFERMQMPGMNTSVGAKKVEYLAVANDKFTPHLAGGKEVYRPTSMSGVELKKVLAKNQSMVKKAFLKEGEGATAYINGGFYNSGFGGIPPNTPDSKISRFAEHSSIGKSKIDGVRLPAVIPPPEKFADDYHKVKFPNGSLLTSGPLLADKNGKTFTDEKAAEERYLFDQNAFRPGHLSHAEHPNPRSAISMPEKFGIELPVQDVDEKLSSKTNSVRLIIGKADGARGANSEGFTMAEWSTVTARLGSFNENPGKAVNLDGGASTTLGVIDKDGKKLLEARGISDKTPTATTFIALKETPPNTSTMNRMMLKLRNVK